MHRGLLTRMAIAKRKVHRHDERNIAAAINVVDKLKFVVQVIEGTLDPTKYLLALETVEVLVRL